jgi:hypothetical protein
MAPTLTPSEASSSCDPVTQELNVISRGLEKLENKKLAMQRFVPSEKKSESLSKLALGAKLERALDRRLGGQDAVMRKKKKTGPVVEERAADVDNEKAALA